MINLMDFHALVGLGLMMSKNQKCYLRVGFQLYKVIQPSFIESAKLFFFMMKQHLFCILYLPKC
jgi:hypothetical protein